MANAQKIDLHSHLVPPFYRTLLEKHYPQPDGMPGLPAWTPEAHLEFMDSNGISKTILSLSTPGLDHFGDDPALNPVTLAQQVNDYSADVKCQHPSRFGFFASLPLPDVEASVAEIKRVLSPEINADGFILMSNYRGLYLGDPLFRPVLKALDEAALPVFVHPTVPCSHMHTGHLPQPERFDKCSPLAAHYRIPMFEFLFDEARSIIDLIASGSASAHRGIRWIVPHCGGVLPTMIDRLFLAERVGMQFPMGEGRSLSGLGCGVGEEETRRVFREQFYFDIMGNPVTNVLESLLKFVGKDKLVFGTDTPWMPFSKAGEIIKQLEKDLPGVVGGEEWLEKAYVGNATQLLQRK